MLTGGMGIAGVEGVWAGDGGDWIAAVLTAQGGKKGNWGKERAAVIGVYAVWGAYMGHVGGSVSVYGRLMQCMSGWRRKGRRMRGLGGE